VRAVSCPFRNQVSGALALVELQPWLGTDRTTASHCVAGGDSIMNNLAIRP
jgi:hypothetical protein